MKRKDLEVPLYIPYFPSIIGGVNQIASCGIQLTSLAAAKGLQACKLDLSSYLADERH